MLILIPWKPVAIFVLVMAAFIMFGYFASSLMRGRNPFAEDWNKGKQAVYGQAATQPKPTHKTN